MKSEPYFLIGFYYSTRGEFLIDLISTITVTRFAICFQTITVSIIANINHLYLN